MLAVITMTDLNDFIQHQFALFSWLEDNPALLAAERSPFDEENRAFIEVGGQSWSYALFPDEIEFTVRATGKTIILNRRQRSPFEFSTRSLLRFLLTTYEDARLNEMVVDNWIVRQMPTGRVVASDYTPDFYALQ